MAKPGRRPRGHPDVSPWAFTPELGFAAKMVTLNMVVFWSAVLGLFWMCQRGQQQELGGELSDAPSQTLAPAPTQEA